MFRITRQMLANGVASRWKDAYPRLPEQDWKSQVAGRLSALGPNPDPDEVDRVIGNGSWTRIPDCDECGAKDQTFVVQVGQPEDYESNTIHLCPSCIGKLSAVNDSTLA